MKQKKIKWYAEETKIVSKVFALEKEEARCQDETITLSVTFSPLTQFHANIWKCTSPVWEVAIVRNVKLLLSFTVVEGQN